jgi:hypothetical protein
MRRLGEGATAYVLFFSTGMAIQESDHMNARGAATYLIKLYLWDRITHHSI